MEGGCSHASNAGRSFFHVTTFDLEQVAYYRVRRPHCTDPGDDNYQLRGGGLSSPSFFLIPDPWCHATCQFQCVHMESGAWAGTEEDEDNDEQILGPKI
jgi:hypothetical protein